MTGVCCCSACSPGCDVFFNVLILLQVNSVTFALSASTARFAVGLGYDFVVAGQPVRGSITLNVDNPLAAIINLIVREALKIIRAIFPVLDKLLPAAGKTLPPGQGCEALVVGGSAWIAWVLEAPALITPAVCSVCHNTTIFTTVCQLPFGVCCCSFRPLQNPPHKRLPSSTSMHRCQVLNP